MKTKINIAIIIILLLMFISILFISYIFISSIDICYVFWESGDTIETIGINYIIIVHNNEKYILKRYQENIFGEFIYSKDKYK